MAIQINLGNKTFYTISAIAILIISASIVIATGSGNPSIHGHDASEIAYAPTDVKITTSEHNGNFDGYAKMNNWIQLNGCSGYHVCDSVELTRWLQAKDFQVVNCWFNSDENSEGSQRDCIRWTTQASSSSGYMWVGVQDGQAFPTKVFCNNNLPICCCK